MARGKRRVAYRRRHQNRFSLFLVSLVVLMIMVVVAVRSVELQRKIAGYDTQIASLSAQIDAETARAEEIEEYRKYTQTKAYVEEVAKNKLGLVYEGEILFKEDKKAGRLILNSGPAFFVAKNEGNIPPNLTKRKKQWLYNREDRKGNSHGDRETGTEKSRTEVMCTGIHAVSAEAVGVCGEF